MSAFSLTPASVSFLTQFILAFAITTFLINRLRSHRNVQLALLTGFFALVTVFITLLFLETVFSPYYRLLAVYAQNTVLALALVLLNQFAYRFPEQYPRHKWEARAVLVISLAYFLWEMLFMIYRYISLLGQGNVFYRPGYASYSMAFVLLLAPIAFLRQCLASDQRAVSWLRKLLKPSNKGARGARNFVLVFGILFLLGVLNVSLIFGLPHTVYNAFMSIGVLVALWLFASNYIDLIPSGVNVSAKLSILVLTLFLTLLGSVGWLIASPYIATFQPDLKEHQTLRFTPNTSGKYDVTEVDFNFQTPLGEKVLVQPQDMNRNYKVEFTFPFYGKSYSEIYVASSGAIGLGEPFWQPNLQAATASAPTIFPLVIDLDQNPDPKDSGGLFVRKEPDRLILTWNHLPALYQPNEIYTFQAVLYTNGVFEFTYNGLPHPITFNPDSTPSANPWMRGAVSGQGEPLHNISSVAWENAGTADLIAISQTDEAPLIENYQLAFRRYLHKFMLPVAWVTIGGSLLLLLAIPLLMRFSVLIPLKALTSGVQRIEAGERDVSILVESEDEIGYLTHSFNLMAARLKDLVTGLEERVAERTLELTTANNLLEEQLSEIKSLQRELQEQAIRDPLTNAFNRRYLLETMERELSRTVRAGTPFSLIMIDVDHFKKFNDEHGHVAGDLVLKCLVDLLMETTRREDAVCRYGGEEFVVLMPGASLETAYQRAELWRLGCEKMKIEIDEKTIGFTISVGVVTSFDPTATVTQLLVMADQAMYQAKAAGRNCTVVF